MNKLSKTIGGTLVVLALAVSALAMTSNLALATSNFNVSSDFMSAGLFAGSAGSDTTTAGEWVTESESSFTECVLEVNEDLVTIGDSITLSWRTTGFTNITINGQRVSATSGSMTITNLQNSTAFTLEALNDSGSRCTQQLQVTCIPPVVPKVCALEVQKQVNKTTASPQEELTYTIIVKNIGDGACTGSGVLIEDVLDPYVTYLRHTVSSNFGAGYAPKPVYTNLDRTLHFNGFDLTPGESGTITWVGKVGTPTTCGDFEVKNQAKATAYELNNFKTWVYSQTVKTAVDNNCPVPKPPVCTLIPTTQTVGYGGSAVLTWTTDDATTVTLTGAGLVALDGTITTAPLYTNKTYSLLATGPDGQVTCVATVTVTPEPPAPTCTLLPATQTIQTGNTANLSWTTTNASAVTLTDFGTVTASGTRTTVALTANKSYTLVATGNGKTVTCTAAVVVTEVPPTLVPRCDSFTANPATIMKGSSTTLAWQTTNATTVYLNNGVGTVAADGSVVVSPLASLVYQLTVQGTGDQVKTCSVPVTVEEPKPVLSCANNVTFTASDTSIRRGDATTLTWSTSNLTAVSISGINATALAGSQSVSPASDSTYVLTATRGTESVSCPLTVAVSSGGGGGGGSSNPRCELTISDKKIKAGDKVTLKWNTSRATEVTLSDDRGKELFSTEDYRAIDKKKYYDHEITVKPTRDTTYILLAERGSKDDECTVKVAVTDGVTVLESRDQKPLVAGISLSQVPYTGFEAGPFMTAMFYLILIAWSLLISYLIVLRQKSSAERVLVNEAPIVVTQNRVAMEQALAVRPDVFASVTPAPTDRRVEKVAPMNLPTGPAVIGYENVREEGSTPVVAVNPHQATDAAVTDLENRAHAQKALLSSDAVRLFIGSTEGTVNRHETLDTVIAEAKKMYPLEDGWIVINESRMRNLCTVCTVGEIVSNTQPFIPATIPEGSGSLAEAIVTGNVVAAYQMIGNRPMFALADAAADLDSIYRIRQGGEAEVSELLTSETAKLSTDQIKNMITALTSALDGTYTDEASAVKMAIMKAVKAGV